jgi:Anti-sigma-K factor rskA, C-terminal/Putative zinc-finger
MSAVDHQRYEEDIGAYLLGALPNGEHDQFEVHLATCHVCQDELERLKGAADALPRSVEQYEPPPALKRALMDQVYAETEPEKIPRRSLAERLGLSRLGGLSPQVAVVATAFVLLVGVLSGYAISQVSGGNGSTSTVAASVDTTRVGHGSANLVLNNDGRDGGQLHLTSMPQPRAGQVYEVWLDRGDHIDAGPLFSVDRNGNGVAAVPGNLDGVKRVMVTRERAGGAQQPTEAPVVVAKTA